MSPPPKKKNKPNKDRKTRKKTGPNKIKENNIKKQKAKHNGFLSSYKILFCIGQGNQKDQLTLYLEELPNS